MWELYNEAEEKLDLHRDGAKPWSSPEFAFFWYGGEDYRSVHTWDVSNYALFVPWFPEAGIFACVTPEEQERAGPKRKLPAKIGKQASHSSSSFFLIPWKANFVGESAVAR